MGDTVAASTEGPVRTPDPSSVLLSFAECKQAARSLRSAEHGRQALAYLRPRGMTGIYRQRPPPAVLLYVLSRQSLVIWRSPDEFAVLRPPEATTVSGNRRVARWQWLDRWWDALVTFFPPFVALLLAVPGVFVPMLRLAALLLASAVIFYVFIAILASMSYGLLCLYRRFMGRAPGRSEAGEMLIGQSWSISLCHVTDPSRVEHVLQAVRDRVGKLAPTAESDQEDGATTTLVWDERCITTPQAREASYIAGQVTRVAESGVGLLVMREPGDESVPRVGVNMADPVHMVGLFTFAVAVIVPYQAVIVSDHESAACGMQCAGRPAGYGDALYWLLSHLVLLGDPAGLSAETVAARIYGLMTTLLGVTTIGVIVAAGVQTVRARNKKAQELEDKVRRSLEASAMAAWGSIFINYRRANENHTLSVAELHRRLSGRFGPDKVFFDIRSMPPGTRYPDDLRANLDSSKVLIAVIQQGWLKRLNQRRNATEIDWVRFEISTALRTGKTVIPVLLNDVPMPTAGQLPADIADLANRQACRLRWTTLDEDMTRLFAAIEPRLRAGD